MALPFVKLHGIGNDFVLVDDLAKPPHLPSQITPELARRLCDRHFGVGCDQVLWLKAPAGPASDARMEILNPDGSEAEMCGNGVRAAAVYLYRHGPKNHREEYRIETLGGLKVARLTEGGTQVEVVMGVPLLGAADPSSGEDLDVRQGAGGSSLKFRFVEVDMGNPHAVIFVPDVSTVDLEGLGPLIENHPRFKNRTNVEFVSVRGSAGIRVRVWERGAGVTLACGTGACASAVAAIASGRVKGPAVEVALPGGDLVIRWNGPGQPVFKRGPAEEVFRGEFLI